MGLFFMVAQSIGSDRKISALLSYSLKMMSIFGMCQITIFSLPFLNVYVAIFICSSSSPYSEGMQCYSGIYIAHLVIAVLGAIMYLMISLFYGLLYIELNPFSRTPFAGPQQNITLYRLTFKALLLVYITVDYKGTYATPFIGVLCVIYLSQSIYRVVKPKSFNQSIFECQIFCDGILLFATVAILLHIFFDDEVPSNVGVFYIVLCSPFIYITSVLLINQKQLRFMRKGFKNFHKDHEMEEYIVLLLSMITQGESANQFQRLLLEGVLIQHSEFCQKIQNCPCDQLSHDRIDDHQPIFQNKAWYVFVEVLTNEALMKFPKSRRLHLLNSYLQKVKLSNQFKSLYELIIIQELQPNIREEFSLFRCKHDLESDMMDDEFKMSDGNRIDVSSVINFQNIFVDFQHKITNCINLHHEFWTDLLQEQPDSFKLQLLGSQITTSVDEVEIIYKQLLIINPNNIKCLKIYGNFQNEIINNEIEGPRILEKADQLAKSQLASSVNEKNGDNGQTCTLTVSGNIGFLGQILNVSTEILQVLGYTKSDIIGQNISRLMPKVIGDTHDSLMRSYLDKSQSHVIGKERLIFAQNKTGFMVPCLLMIKVLPQLDRGIQIIGFLQQLHHKDEDEQFFILYNPSSFQIYGITANCQHRLGIPSQLVYGISENTNEFTLNHIVQDMKILLDKQNNIDKGALSHFLLHMDMSSLRQHFMIEAQESVQELNQQQSDLMPQNSQLSNHIPLIITQTIWRVKCQVVKYNFGDLPVNLLKFNELNEAVDVLKQTQKSSPTLKIRVKKKHVKKNVQQQQDEVVENEDRSSVNSISSALNDDMRSLKDFKAMISEKTVPKQIRNLQITLSLLTILLIVVQSVNLYTQSNQNVILLYGFYGLQFSYEREIINADLTFNCRFLQQIAIGNYQRVEEQTLHDQTLQLQKNITEQLTYLQSNSYDIIQNKIFMQSIGVTFVPDQNYTLYTLLQNNATPTSIFTINEAIYELINQGMIIKNVNLTTFNITQQITATQRSFYFIIKNGLYEIREASQQVSQKQLQDQQSLIQSNMYIFIVFLILNVLFMVLAQIIIVPVLRNVGTSNRKVLSLFGLIPLVEIQILEGKCQNYLLNFVDEKTVDQINKIQIPQQPKLGQEKSQEEEQILKEKYFEVDNEDRKVETPLNEIQIEMQNDKQMLEQNELLPNKELNSKGEPYQIVKTKQELEQEQQQLDVEEMRVEKLQNFKGSQSNTLYIKLGSFYLLFFAFFVMQFVLEYVFLLNMNFLSQHMQLTYYRPMVVKYSTYFGLEEIITKDQVNLDLENAYHSSLYSNDRDLFDSVMNSFPSGFDQYLNNFQSLNYGDICSHLDLINDANLTNSWCKSVYSGILQKGLRTSIVSLALDTQDNINLQSGKTLKQIINGDSFYQIRQMLTYIIPSLNSLNDLYMSCLENYIQSTYLIEMIIYGAFILGWVFLVLILWIPHLSSLSIQIWRTKGMLNLIPLSIIQKYDKLKDAFLHSNIFQMVK